MESTATEALQEVLSMFGINGTVGDNTGQEVALSTAILQALENNGFTVVSTETFTK